VTTVWLVEGDRVVAEGQVSGRAAFEFVRRELVTLERHALVEDREGCWWKLSKIRRKGLTRQGFARGVETRFVAVGSRDQTPVVPLKLAALILEGY